MKINLLCIFILLLSAFNTTVLAQQPVEEWARRFNGKGSQNEFAVAIAVDAAGNSYVAGTTNRSESSEIGSNIVVIKYAPSGEQLWRITFREELITTRAEAIAVDDQGGVYITGYSGYYADEYDYITIRLDAATGEETWTQQYNGPTNESDIAHAIVVDNKGGIYVTGSSINDYATIRYEASTGKETWVKRYNASVSSYENATAIAIDTLQGVYVTGNSFSEAEESNIVTIHYDMATGEERWINRYTSSKGGSIHAEALAVDSHGGVYVTGTNSLNTVGNDSDYITLRFNAATGEQTWESRYNGPGNGTDNATAIAVDKLNGVYVTGYSLGINTSYDYATVRYDATTGEQTWESRYNSPGKKADYASAIAVDEQKGLYVTGYSTVEDLDYDYVTIRYDKSTGEQDWIQRYDGPGHGTDYARDLVATNNGSIYVTGFSDGGNTGFDITTIRYDASSGGMDWVQRQDIEGSVSDRPISVVVDAEGNSYVTGINEYEYDLIQQRSSIVTIKYSPSGDELWVKSYKEGLNNWATAITLDNQGGVYITGYSDAKNSNYDFVTIRYDAVTGKETWVQFYSTGKNSYNLAIDIATDKQGGVYVTGYSSTKGDREIATLRYDASTGSPTWISRYSDGNVVSSAIAVDNAGGVYVTGYGSNENNSTSDDFITLRYEATTGRESWVQRYNGEINNSDRTVAIAVDNKGGVYITGESYNWNIYNTYFATVRYDAATGEEVWVQHFDSEGNGFEQPSDIAVDSTGGVYVTGNSAGDYLTLRYDAATGQQDWLSRYNRQGISDEYASAIALDGQGNVYVTGRSHDQSDHHFVFSTVKYAAANGELLWDIFTEGPFDVAVDMAVDGENNIIISGYSRSSLTDADFLTVKYSLGQCPVLADATIQGNSTAAVSSEDAVYTLTGSNATSLTWRITSSDGADFTDFTGQGSSSISVDWPAAPDVYKLNVNYGAGENCPTRDTTLYVHVFDPEAGFVTGGGWLISPANPAYELMQQGSRANWSMVSKYRQGPEHTTQGSLMLLLTSGPTIFRSTSVEDGSLVITGNRAYFRGQGTLSYSSSSGGMTTDPRSFEFLVSATDGNLQGAKEEDRLRILIWEVKADGTRGAVVYDNQPACSANLDENAPTCQAIGGGNITIHKPNLKTSRENAVLALEGQPGETGLVAYPTAFSERTTLAFTTEQDADYTLELYDLKGALVRRVATGTAQAGQRYEHEVTAEGLPKGLYVARLAAGEKVQTVKIVLER